MNDLIVNFMNEGYKYEEDKNGISFTKDVEKGVHVISILPDGNVASFLIGRFLKGLNNSYGLRMEQMKWIVELYDNYIKSKK